MIQLIEDGKVSDAVEDGVGFNSRVDRICLIGWMCHKVTALQFTHRSRRMIGAEARMKTEQAAAVRDEIGNSLLLLERHPDAAIRRSRYPAFL